MLKFLWNFRYVILFVLWAVITCVTMGKEWVKKKALQSMLAAKQMAKDGFLKSGPEQEDWAVNALYILLQRLKIPFITKENLKTIIRKLYLISMDFLDDGQINSSVK